jgi:hypothetical protein
MQKKQKTRHQQKCTLVKREVMSLRVHVLRDVKMKQFKKQCCRRPPRPRNVAKLRSRFPQSRALIDREFARGKRAPHHSHRLRNASNQAVEDANVSLNPGF